MYADELYYTDTFLGTVITTEIEKYLDKASDDIDSMCYGRIRGKGFNNLSEFQQDRIKKAVCEQAEYMFQYGSYLNSPMKSYSVGKTSVNLEVTKVNGIHTIPRVIQLLEDTGLKCLTL